jgi:hypothetical protein
VAGGPRVARRVTIVHAALWKIGQLRPVKEMERDLLEG